MTPFIDHLPVPSTTVLACELTPGDVIASHDGKRHIVDDVDPCWNDSVRVTVLRDNDPDDGYQVEFDPYHEVELTP